MLLTSRLYCLKAIFLLLQPLTQLRHSFASFCIISILPSILFSEHLSCPWHTVSHENRNDISGPLEVSLHVHTAHGTGD